MPKINNKMEDIEQELLVLEDTIDRLNQEAHEKKFELERKRYQTDIRERKMTQHIIDKLNIMKNFDNKCYYCGIEVSRDTPPDCFDFHHLRDKKFSISQAIASKYITYEQLIEELSNCILLCAICHRRLHAGVFIISEY